MKKYPMTLLFVAGAIIIFIIPSIWRCVDFFTTNLESIIGPIFGIFLLLLLIAWFIVLFKFWNKFWKSEQKTRTRNFEQSLKNRESQKIVLVVKRNVLANVSLVFSILLLWIVFFMDYNYNNIGFNITRIVAVVWFVYGLVFSCFVFKKKVVFENDKFTIAHANGTDIVNVDDIVDVKLKVKDPKNSDPRQFFFADIEIELLDGEKLICEKADKVMNLDSKIKTIQRIRGNNKIETNYQQ